jgi:hypothetical protein
VPAFRRRILPASYFAWAKERADRGADREREPWIDSISARQADSTDGLIHEQIGCVESEHFFVTGTLAEHRFNPDKGTRLY